MYKRYNPFIENKLSVLDEQIYEQLSSKPLENIFNLNLNELKAHCKKINFNSSRYDLRPDLVSWDHYQSLALTNVIMFVNNCSTFLNFKREFIGDTILIPDINYVRKLLNSKI